MQSRPCRMKSSFAAVVLSALAVNAVADIAEVATQDGKLMTFEYEGDKLRINMPDQPSYMLLRDQRLYMVTDNNGQVMVVDMNSAFNMFGGMAAGAAPEMVSGELISLESLGRNETVAGIPGEVYLLKYTDHQGTQQESELVLSGDPRAVGFRDAVANMAVSIGSAMKSSGYRQEAETGEEMQRVLEKQGKGVLRYGKDMQVHSITKKTIADERFVLPAAPTDLGGLMGGMMGAGSAPVSQDSDSYVEEKAERQQDRVEQKTDRAVDRATDNAVDRVLDKAFGKIFGN